MFTRAPSLAAAALALGVALAGCTSDPEPAAEKITAAPSPSAESPEGRLLDADRAKAALPAATDLPGSGWTPAETTVDDFTTKVAPASCSPLMNEYSTDFPTYKTKLATKEAVTFANEPAGGAEVIFEVTSWTRAADSGLPLAVTKLADSCKTFTATDEDGTYGMAAEHLTPLPLGEEQATLRLTATYQGRQAYLTIAQVRIGHNLLTVGHVTADPTDRTAEFKPVVESMIAKLAA